MRKILRLRNVLIMLLSFAAGAVFAQDRTVTGKVTSSEDGSSVPGVNVVVKGTTNGTTTDADGNYRLSVPAGSNTLVFSFIGLTTQEVAIGDRTTVDVGMAADVTQLSEVVVVGYGTQEKRTLTSAISTVKGSDIALVPVQSFDQAMIGKAAGMQVVVTNGLVGTAPTIRIRGSNSITSGQTPLFVVDGVPALTGNQSGTASGNPLGDINPNDIESIEVLKDGAATAIYGSRAANGVVLVTTKKGKSGKPQLSFDAQTGVNQIARRYDMLDANEFVAISNEKFASGGVAPQAFPGSNNENTDWQNEIFRTGWMQNYNLNMSGGTKDVSYYISGGFMKQEGAVKNNSVDRQSMLAKVDYNGVDWLSAGMKLQATHQVNTNLNTGSNALSGNVLSALKAFPNVSPLDPDDPTGYNISPDTKALGWGNNLQQIASNYTNPAYILTHNKQTADNYRILSNAFLQVNIMDGLNLRTQYGLDIFDGDDFISQDPFHGDGSGGTNGFVGKNAIRVSTWNWQNTLNYKKTFGENHSIGVTLGYEAQKTRNEFFSGSGQNFSNVFFIKQGLIGGAYATQFSGGDLNFSGFDSRFARLNYDYAGKYILGLSFRNDAISSLPKDNRVGNFFGASAGWIVSQEGFWSVSAINNFKLRASYAEVGNISIGFYPYVGSYGPQLYGSQTGFSFTNVGNNALQWETSKKLDIGADFGFLNNRITLAIDYYRNDIDGLILAAPTAASAGMPNNSINKNVGAMQNSGIEITIGAQTMQQGSFTWDTDLTFTTNKNKITALNDNQDIVSVPTLYRVGEPANSIYVYDYAGVNPANGNPLYNRGDGSTIQGNPDDGKYYLYNPASPAATEATSALSEKDYKVIGQFNPKWFGGLNNTFRWKGIDLGIMLTYAGGNKIFNATRQGAMQMEFANNYKEILNRWTPDHTDTDVPRLKLNQSTFLNNNSSRWVENGDYLRIQNASLGYNLPKAAIGSILKGSVSSVRIYAQVRNAFVFTKYKGTDPENFNVGGFGNGGVDNNTNPLMRTYTIGLSIGL